MQIQHRRLLSAALLSCSALIVAPAAGAKSPAKRRADLAMQRVSLSPKFVVIKPSGKPTAQISVTLSIRNIGNAPAPPTDTAVKLMQGSRVLAREHIPLPRLAAGHAATQIAIFSDVEPQLGLMDAHAIADSTVELAGSVLNDSKATPNIPVIAQRWTGSMESEVQTPGIIKWDETDDAKTGADVAFRFSGVDGLHRFFYTVGGTVNQTASFTGQGCTGGGETSASMARWGQDSGLYLSQDLTQYQAIIRGSLGPPFTVDVTCPDTQTVTPVSIVMKDLLTEASVGGLRQPMRPTARVLGDMGTLGILITITNSWHLVADVP